MKPINRRTFLKTVPAVGAIGSGLQKYRSWLSAYGSWRPAYGSWLPALAGSSRRQAPAASAPFGQDYPHLDSQTTGQWWVTRAPGEPGIDAPGKAAKKVPQIIELNVPRDQVVAFALYAHEAGVLKLT